MTVRLVAAAIAFLLLPFLFFRAATLRKYLAVELLTYAFAALSWQQVEGIDPYLAAVTLCTVKLAIFSLFLACGTEVRWSPWRAAAGALVVYALLIPAMQRSAIDGDEPYYLLITESLARDGDVDLANQYAHLDRSATRRADLVPQFGDRVGARGEQFSRLERLLPMVMVPGYLAAGVNGALATIALFGALLVRSTMRWLEEEGIDARTSRAIFPFFAFAPPILFYSARIWPEVPGALLFVEALRGVRARRLPRWLAAAIALALLKRRFVLVAVPIAVQALIRSRRVAAAAVGALTAAVLIAGGASGRLGLSSDPAKYAIGFFGLLLDGAAGLSFQAPFYLLGIFALTQWRSMPEGFRAGIVSALLYIACLVPRAEWHGGWSPPLRYIVFVMPVLALGAASIWSRVATPLVALLGVWTAALVVHGVAYPWRLFHIANGENATGEWLSALYRSDFSRLFPSFIRLNSAATVAVFVLVGLCIVAGLSLHFGRRLGGLQPAAILILPLIAVALASLYCAGRAPGRVIQFEDAHVIHNGGALYPHEYPVARFIYRGGWMLHGGNSVSFLAHRGPARLYYAARAPAIIRLGPRLYRLGPTGDRYGSAAVFLEREGRNELQCLSGSVNLDRIE